VGLKVVPIVIESVTSPPWLLRKRVLPQHTDHGGVMWHGAYLAWLEEARVEALAQVGLPYQELVSRGLEMPVVHLELDYLKGLRHGEHVLLESWPLERCGVRFPWRTTLSRSGGEKVAEARVELVVVSLAAQSWRVMRKAPEPLASALKRLQRGPEASP
jgi:acyl-CoA thioester hydrolase